MPYKQAVHGLPVHYAVLAGGRLVACGRGWHGATAGGVHWRGNIPYYADSAAARQLNACHIGVVLQALQLCCMVTIWHPAG